MFIIARRHERGAEWLTSTAPQNWGEREKAMTFLTMNEARRAAVTLKLSGDWSIEIAAPAAIAPHRDLANS
jgi:hypothetical protein